MANWLGRLTGGRRAVSGAGSALAARLSAYAPYRPPHPGFGRELSRAAAEENFAFFVEAREQRLAAVGELLGEAGLDARAALSAADPAPFLGDLHHWSLAAWPALYDPAQGRVESWWEEARRGRSGLYSMLHDLGVLLGEMVARRRPDYAWTLDVNLRNKAEDMASYQRPVMQLAPDPAIPSAIVFDFEEIAVNHYRQAGSPNFNLGSPLGRGVLEALSGAHERHWRS